MLFKISMHVLVYVILMIGGYAGIMKLRRRTPSHVYVLIYFASLAGWVTFLIGWAAISRQAFTDAGVPKDNIGQSLLVAFNFFSDIEGDFKFVAALVSIVIVPQVIAFLLSGMAGCASKVHFIELAIDFLGWSFAKSLAVASGVFYATASLQVYQGWHEWLGSDVLSKVTLATIFFVASMYTLMQRKDFERKLISEARRKTLRDFEAFATRHAVAVATRPVDE